MVSFVGGSHGALGQALEKEFTKFHVLGLASN